MKVISPFQEALDRISTVRREVVVGDITTAYWEYGSAQRARTIVMIHGFRGDHHGLEPIVARMEGNIHVIIPDLPGFGESADFTGPATIDEYAQWLSAFVNQVAPGSETFVIGHSFGSIVVSASLAGGLDVTSACLINPIAANALKGPRGVLTRLAVFYYQLAAWLPEKLGFALLRNGLIVRIMSVTMAKTKNSDLRAWIHDQHDRYFSHFSTREGVLSAFRTSVSNDVSEYADKITVPVLLLVADLDDITALPEQEKLHQSLPLSTLEVVTGVGHLVHYEAPEFVADNIRRYLETH